MTKVLRTRWYAPASCVVLGFGCFAALWAGGRAWDGLVALLAMTALGAVTFFGGRSDMIRGLRGDGRDEYWARIDVHATAFAGHVTIAVIISMCFWEWAHGRSGTPYTQLGGIAGVAYLVSLGLLRWRS
jgi:hypothetical protein